MSYSQSSRMAQAVAISALIYASIAWLLIVEPAPPARFVGAALLAGHAIKDCGWPDARWPTGCDALALVFAAVLATCGERRLTLAIALVIAAGHVRHALHGGRRYYEVF